MLKCGWRSGEGNRLQLTWLGFDSDFHISMADDFSHKSISMNVFFPCIPTALLFGPSSAVFPPTVRSTSSPFKRFLFVRS